MLTFLVEHSIIIMLLSEVASWAFLFLALFLGHLKRHKGMKIMAWVMTFLLDFPQLILPVYGFYLEGGVQYIRAGEWEQFFAIGGNLFLEIGIVLFIIVFLVVSYRQGWTEKANLYIKKKVDKHFRHA